MAEPFKDPKEQIYELVEELTTSGESKLNEKILKDLKNFCKKSDENLGHVYRGLLNQLEKEHSQIRLSCFQVINELFQRSHKLRQMVLEDLHQIMELSVETNDERKLPPPSNIAKVLKSTALSNIENWYLKFGKHYKKLELGYDFLKRVKRIDFAGMRSRTLLERQRQDTLEAKQKELEKRAIARVEKEMKENSMDIESVMKQGNSCLNLVLPRPGDLYPTENSNIEKQSTENSNGNDCLQANSIDSDAISTPAGNYHGIPTQNYKLTINITLGKINIMETEDNRDILATLRDLMNEIKIKFMPMVNKWINILTKCNNVNEKLEKCMQIKGRLQELIEKYNEMEIQPLPLPGCSSSIERTQKIDDIGSISDSDDDDDQFEDVPELSDEAVGAAANNIEKRIVLLKQQTSGVSSIGNARARPEQLKKKAPIVQFDHDLKYWGNEKLHITPITKNDSLHKFWSHCEVNDDFIPDGLEASLKNRAIMFTGEFQAVKWKCRAPLANGKLCERQDRIKCPFHGKVIPRDEFGVPSKSEDFAAESERKRKLVEKEANELQQDIELGLEDLGGNDKKKINNSSKLRYSRLTNLKTITNSSRRRLERKVLKKGALRRVDETLNAIEKRRNLEKFGSNFNYQFER